MDILEIIFKEHIKKLKNLKYKKNKLIVCFSAIPGSGKTFIAKKIEKKLKAVRISNDEIRIIIKKFYGEDPQDILHKYLRHFFNKYSFNNKMIILDMGIDRNFDLIEDFAKRKKYKVIIVRIVSSMNKIREAIKVRNKKSSEFKKYFKQIPRWIDENERFNKTHKADIVIHNKFEQLDLKALCSIINNG
jgi:hypothetical protein